MEEIFRFCRRHNLFIVSDEVYWNESFKEFEFVSFGHLSTYEVPVIVLCGMEKTFLVPGWSISWMIFFDQANRLNEIKYSAKIISDLFEGPCSFMSHALP